MTTFAEQNLTPPFSGTTTEMFYSVALGGLILSTGLKVDDMATDGNWDALGSIDGLGGVVPEGEYQFKNTYDMGAVYDVNLLRQIVSQPFQPGDFWDDKTDLIDTWPVIDATNLDAVSALLFVRTTDDNPSGTPTWTSWKEFTNALVRGRGFQFKTIASSEENSQNILITELGVQMELQQRMEQSDVITATAGTNTITFVDAFYEAPAVGVSAYDMVSGDYYAITNVTRTGFQIVFRNSGGTAVTRNFNYNAVGYGLEIS
jgi:hypothetical protein